MLATGGLAGAVWLAFAFLPWKPLVANRLAAALEARGLQNVHFTLSDLNLRGTVFRGITIGAGQPFTLDNLVLRYSPQTREASLEAGNPQFNSGGLKVRAAKADAHTQNMAGDWHLQDLQVESGSIDLPVMAGAGKLKYEADVFSLSGQIKSKDNIYNADFSFNYPFAHSQDAKLVLAEAVMPWKGGRLTARDVTVPLDGKQPVNFILQVKQVPVDALLQALTGKQVAATGAVSGSLPLIIGQDGTVSFGAGTLQADGAGIVAVPPDAIPGDNAQVAMVREIMKNFHYKGLSIALKNDTGNRIAILIALEGNNPDMYDGRPVKLNVRLAGDVLGYIRQNILFLTAPETMLNQGQK